jgi:ribosomal protein S14
MVQNSATTRSPKIRQVDHYTLSDIALCQKRSRPRKFYFKFLICRILFGHYKPIPDGSFLVILVHVKKNSLYATLTPPLGVEIMSNKINGHHIMRQN